MNRIDERLWPVHEVPLGFAEKAVGQMLAMPAARQRSRRFAHPYRCLAFAALLTAGAAAGWRDEFTNSQVSRRAVAAPLHTTVVAPMKDQIPRMNLAMRPPAVRCETPRARPAREGSATAPANLTKVAPPRVPACQCERGFSDFICDCY